MDKKLKKLILIDGNAIIHRSYHALPPLSTKKGELVNAVYGFTSTLLSVISQFKPDYIVASFDLAGPTFRHEKFDDYKANREKADDELYAQIPRVKEVVNAFNIPIYEKAGFEADDIIGTIARLVRNEKTKIETIIVTGDMDTLQLVNDTTKVYTMKRGLSDSILYDAEKVFERYGLRPDQLIDFKGLRGDPSDNIPGVKGIGEKTAVTLLQKYKDINGVYENIGEIKCSVKEKLERDKSNAVLSKDLATIILDVPISFELEKSKLHDFDRAKIADLLKELNFFSLIKRLPDSENSLEAKGIKSEHGNGVADFKYLIADEKNAAELFSEFKDAKEISLALGEKDSELSGITISQKTGRATYFPVHDGKLYPAIKTILENPDIKKVGFDLKLILKQLKTIAINLQGINWDVMIAAYVLNPGEKISLEKIILSEIGEEIDFSEKKKGQLSLVADDTEEKQKAAIETCKKADYTLKLKLSLEKEIARISEEQTKVAHTQGTLETVFNNIEMPLVKILSDMEIEGVGINTVIFKEFRKKYQARCKTLKNLSMLSPEKNLISTLRNN